MSVLSILAQQQAKQQDDIRGIAQQFDRMRMQDLGKRFLRQADFSPEGLQSFAEQNNVELPEMQALVELAKQFRQYQKESLPVTKDYETMGPEGNQYTQTRNIEDPNADSVATVLKSMVKPSLKDQVNPDGSKSMVGVNPFSLSAKDVTGQGGAPVQTGSVPTIMSQGMTDSGTPINLLRNKVTGDPVGRAQISGQSPQQKTQDRVNEYIAKKQAALNELKKILGRDPTEEEVTRIFGAGSSDVFINPFAAGAGGPSAADINLDSDQPQESKGKLTVEAAKEYLKQAGGDKEKARELARQDGWEL